MLSLYLMWSTNKVVVVVVPRGPHWICTQHRWLYLPRHIALAMTGSGLGLIPFFSVDWFLDVSSLCVLKIASAPRSFKWPANDQIRRKRSSRRNTSKAEVTLVVSWTAVQWQTRYSSSPYKLYEKSFQLLWSSSLELAFLLSSGSRTLLGPSGLAAKQFS